MFTYTDTGYVKTDKFYTWFTRAFVPNCGRARPVVLVMDNHDAHISAELIHAARENEVVLVGLPSHTTHLLQPLDVHINGPLKQKVRKKCTFTDCYLMEEITLLSYFLTLQHANY